MMFLEYVIWGAWLPLLGLYLAELSAVHRHPDGLDLNAFAIASLTGMFFGGQLADRYFAQERFLAFSHLVGGLAMLGLAYREDVLAVLRPDAAALLLLRADALGHQRDRVRQPEGRPEGVRPDPGLGHDRLDRRELAVHLHPDRLGEGPGRRWPAGSLLAGHGALDVKTGPAMEAALEHLHRLGRRLAVWPPSASPAAHPAGQERGLGVRPVRGHQAPGGPSILVLFIVTFLDSLVHYCYFFWTSRYLSTIGLPENWIAPAMSIGQIAEIVTMANLGFFLKRLGWRTTMILGILGQVVRFGIYAIGTPDLLWLVIPSNVVHGFAYAFFFATVYIFVDENFPKDIRTSTRACSTC